ncbi:glutathione peroxidase [Thiomicrorhabdus sp. 6S2-11]|jgi:peroxiredoxin (alkyl hydroperoxide reductase subunit C)|uniref:Glutathione peroxidase n=1 Tax=Thiomicrorhabdus marina TaxID=2818442 RepID=A0ABS3Q8C4_9GAMM|nr:glutathione peroxidase [Thiomicrorhabdus marina]MBO1928075.1 glutathione peroxidase [Thiomicrorhabdus marina]
MALPNREGQRVPNVTFPTRQNNDWVNVTTDEIFNGKTVVVFSLPGAFTPTCSSTHLPRFNELAPVFKANGVDEIVCVSVNDTFVMNEWAADQECGNVRVVPDGNGEFTDGMGMLVNKEDLGFGMRSWRYSMLVKDGVIEKMFIEPEVPGDPFEVSDADTMLKYINPMASAPRVATIFTKPTCPFCLKAKSMLEDAGITYEEITVGNSGITSRTLRAVASAGTVPQVFVDGELVGGSEDLEAYLNSENTNAA